jgi:DNA-binding transcriptional MerR regulator
MEQEKEEKWMSLTEYASYKGISLSSIRRYIKSSRVKFELKDGKYFIQVKNFKEKSQSLETKISDLDLELKNLKEENAELRMLIKAYEQVLKNLNIHLQTEVTQ